MCFKVMNIEKTWQDANTDCELSGGQLISLDTEEKFNITVEFVDLFCKYVIAFRVFSTATMV